MEELREEVLEKRRVYPQVCSKLLSKTIDLDIKLLLNRKVVLPGCESWDSYEHSILSKEEKEIENEKITKTLADLRALDKKIPASINKVVTKANDISKVFKVLKGEKHSVLLKNIDPVEKGTVQNAK